MRNRKSTAIILVSMLVLSCFTACGSKESTDSKKSYSADKVEGIRDGDVLKEFSDGVDVGGAVAKCDNGIDSIGDIASIEADGIAGVEVDNTAKDDSAKSDIPMNEDNKIGMLTAGEWNDHSNWGFFKNLVDTKTVELPDWCLDVTNRIKVTVTNADGHALPNEKVALYDTNNNIIWSSVTDKNGISYLFEFDKDTANKVVASDGTEAIIEKIAVDTQSGEEVLASDREVALSIGAEPIKYNNMQIQFIVDTTGSMGDEMLYLQSDFKSIAEEVGTDTKEFSTVFYRDEGDEYVVRTNPFTSEISEITSKLSNESADGGGDEPEAVSDALISAFSAVEWQDDAVKLAFMIFDAPPHTDQSSIDKLNQAITIAVEKGIRVIPVVSSNSQRDTELFGRTLAIATNGTYVFLTDDSGIGGSHLEPIVGDYDVEKLHDIIVRIINEYDQSSKSE